MFSLLNPDFGWQNSQVNDTQAVEFFEQEREWLDEICNLRKGQPWLSTWSSVTHAGMCSSWHQIWLVQVMYQRLPIMSKEETTWESKVRVWRQSEGNDWCWSQQVIVTLLLDFCMADFLVPSSKTWFPCSLQQDTLCQTEFQCCILWKSLTIISQQNNQLLQTQQHLLTLLQPATSNYLLENLDDNYYLPMPHSDATDYTLNSSEESQLLVPRGCNLPPSDSNIDSDPYIPSLNSQIEMAVIGDHIVQGKPPGVSREHYNFTMK